jgi:hypothetical protein
MVSRALPDYEYSSNKLGVRYTDNIQNNSELTQCRDKAAVALALFCFLIVSFTVFALI